MTKANDATLGSYAKHVAVFKASYMSHGCPSRCVAFGLAMGVVVHCAAQLNAGMMVGQGVINVPYTDVRDPIRLEVEVGGEPRTFMFDTGAPTFISKELQARGQFPVLTHAIAKDASGLTDSIALVTIDTLRFGPFLFIGIPALVFDLGHTGAHCQQVSGNVGSNLARFLVVDLDLEHDSVAFASDRGRLRAASSDFHPMRLDQQYDVLFPIELNDGILDTAHFDSGASSFGDLAMSTIGRFKQNYPAEVVDHGIGIVSYGIHGPGEPTEQFVLRPQRLAFCGAELKGVRLDLAGDDRTRLGRGLLAHGRLRIDYPGSQWSFTPYPNALKDDAPDLGFEIVVNGTDVFLGTVWVGTDAERLGLRSGDRLLQVGDVDLTTIDECTVQGSLREALNEGRVRLKVVSREGHEKRVAVLHRKWNR